MKNSKKFILLIIVIMMTFSLIGCADSKSYNEDFTVIFYTGTGKSVSKATLIQPITGLVSGDLVDKPTDPFAPGVEFLGWFKEPAGINLWDFDTDTIERSTVLYSKWNVLDLSITYLFDEAGGEFLDAPESTYTILRTVILPKVSRLGSLFLGWILTPIEDYSVGDTIVKSTSEYNTDLVVYALFENKEYTVRFRSLLTGVSNPPTHTVEFASYMDFPVLNDTATKHFVGWFANDGTETGDWGFQYLNDEVYLGKAVDYDAVTGEWDFIPQGVTLYAKWEDK